MASRRSVVALSFTRSRPLARMSRSANWRIMSRLGSLMSHSATSSESNSGTVRRSPSSLRVNPMLPAPMNAILNDMMRLLLAATVGESARWDKTCQCWTVKVT